METEKFTLIVKEFTDKINSPMYHPNPSCYSWVKLGTDTKLPSDHKKVIIMIRPSKAGVTCDEVTADPREGVAVINNLIYPIDEAEKERAIGELRKFFS